jgi:V-type H+-transporting ATPase proteolipid subunit
MRALIPVVMAGIITVYGLVVAVLIANGINPDQPYSLFSSAIHLGAGLSTGFTGLAAGYAIGCVGDSCVRGYSFQPRLFVAMVLILIFAEVSFNLFSSLGSRSLWTHCKLDPKHKDFK